ncbi:hypothetical protein ACNKHX_19240 [Shigella flexneri]
MYQAIRGGLAGSAVWMPKAPMVMDRNFKPGFRLDLHLRSGKCAGYFHGVARLPLTAAVMEIMQTCEQMVPDRRIMAPGVYYEKLAKSEVTWFMTWSPDGVLQSGPGIAADEKRPPASCGNGIGMKIVITRLLLKRNLSASEVAQAIEKDFGNLPDASRYSPVADGGEGYGGSDRCSSRVLNVGTATRPLGGKSSSRESPAMAKPPSLLKWRRPVGWSWYLPEDAIHS